MAKGAKVAGEDALLRRWVFDVATPTPNPPRPGGGGAEVKGARVREFWVLTNGYSIVRYRFSPTAPTSTSKTPKPDLSLTLPLDLRKTQYSWADDRSGYEDSLGPLRDNDATVKGLQVSRWRLWRTWIDEGRGNAHQVYVDGEGAERSVIEVVWLKGEGDEKGDGEGEGEEGEEG